MNNPLVVREFDKIVCVESVTSQGYVYLAETYFRELEQFIKDYVSASDETDILEFMTIGYKRAVGDVITFKNYVGIIELPSGFQIEILPKISLRDDDNNIQTKMIFLKMLNCLKDFDGKLSSSASLNTDRMNLYEIFIRMYIQETWKLVKRGLKSDYLENEDDLKFYKGKLNVGKQITRNAAHKELFSVKFDEYQVNRPENRLVKATLIKLLRVSRNSSNTKELRQLLYSFELVEESTNYEKDFSAVSLTRGMKEYSLLIQWSRVFLLNKSFTTFAGKSAGKALLFPMEKVFESFIAKQVRDVFNRHSNGSVKISVQDHVYHLFDAPKMFELRPDLVLRNPSNINHPIVVMDTKWKKLNRKASNYGISQTDMYQMYAYAKKYNCQEIWLIYPLDSEMDDVGSISFESVENDDRVFVRVFFVDLNNSSESIQNLYETVF